MLLDLLGSVLGFFLEGRGVVCFFWGGGVDCRGKKNDDILIRLM